MIGIQYDRADAVKHSEAFLANPTPARAGNAAQRLPGAIAEIDRLNAVIVDLLARRNGSGTGTYELTELGMAATDQVAADPPPLPKKKVVRQKPTGNRRARNRPRIDLEDTGEV